MLSWFHVADGLFFRRVGANGTVQIGQGTSFADVTVLQTIPASSWASIVSSMCARGEHHETYNEALEFHQRDAA